MERNSHHDIRRQISFSNGLVHDARLIQPTDIVGVDATRGGGIQ